MNLGGWEWVILVAVALLLFGGSRLAGIGKSAGRAIREFKEETQAGKPAVNPPPATGQTTPSEVDTERKPDTDA